MNVSKANFAEAATQIEALVRTAAFIAIDAGLSMNDHVFGKMEDTAAGRYMKMRKVASKYKIIQFGIALFHEKECEPEMPAETFPYEAHVFNFYLFPEKGDVNVESDVAAFYTERGMDWNTWIREGVPYLNRAEAQKLMDLLLQADESDKGDNKGSAETPSQIVLTKTGDRQTTDDAIEGLKAWLADEGKKEETEFELIETNAFLRKFMYQRMATEFPDLLVESRATSDSRVSKMFVLRLSEDEKAEMRKEKVVLTKNSDIETTNNAIDALNVWLADEDKKGRDRVSAHRDQRVPAEVHASEDGRRVPSSVCRE